MWGAPGEVRYILITRYYKSLISSIFNYFPPIVTILRLPFRELLRYIYQPSIISNYNYLLNTDRLAYIDSIYIYINLLFEKKNPFKTNNNLERERR